ncbi:hypothetical protein J2S30_005330 [Herbaspirillum rubrisubalbicans]|nr:hypothetical protein [Herbaspirillum rubrisubalbicans]MCP1576951.1 hypothetical protein [Herbaspirillum rubrisubalbicans]
MTWTRSLAIAFLWCAADTAYAAYQVQIEAPAPVQSLLKDFLDISRYQDRDDISDEQLKFMMDTVGEQVRELSSTEGYFTPTTKVSAQTEPAANGQPAVRRITLTVDPGPRTEIGATDISVTGVARAPRPGHGRAHPPGLVAAGGPAVPPGRLGQGQELRTGTTAAKEVRRRPHRRLRGPHRPAGAAGRTGGAL